MLFFNWIVLDCFQNVWFILCHVHLLFKHCLLKKVQKCISLLFVGIFGTFKCASKRHTNFFFSTACCPLQILSVWDILNGNTDENLHILYVKMVPLVVAKCFMNLKKILFGGCLSVTGFTSVVGNFGKRFTMRNQTE